MCIGFMIIDISDGTGTYWFLSLRAISIVCYSP